MADLAADGGEPLVFRPFEGDATASVTLLGALCEAGAPVDRPEFALYDVLDLDAFDRLFPGGRAATGLTLTVEGVRVVVTSEGVGVYSAFGARQ